MKRTDSVIALGLFTASFGLYIRTLAPSLLFGDSAEFQTIAYTLGMGHPTGYPIYVLLAKLFTFLPLAEVAYRVNLFSAFCTALTVGVVYLILRRLGAMPVAALYGALALALTPLFWKYAAIAEVYGLSTACFALILLFVLQWKQTNYFHWLFLAGLLGGLSLGMHTIVALSGISILTYLLLSTRQPAPWFQASLGVMTGIVVFLASFLLLDSLDASAGYYNAVVRPSLSTWDMTPDDFDSPVERLAFLYIPPQFRTGFFSVSGDQVKTRMIEFARESSGSRWLALLGFIALMIPRKAAPARWREALLMIMAFITFSGFAITYDIHDFQVFYIYAILILVILIGMGVNAIIEVVTWIPGLPRFVPALWAIGILTLGLYPSVTEISTAWKERIPPMLKGWESYYESPSEPRLEAEQVLSRIEDNAIVFTGWDKLYGFYYVSHVLQGRTEMTFHEAFPQEDMTKFADSTIQYIEENIDVRPIYFTKRPSELAIFYKITRAASGLLRIERK